MALEGNDAEEARAPRRPTHRRGPRPRQASDLPTTFQPPPPGRPAPCQASDHPTTSQPPPSSASSGLPPNDRPRA
eukprot:1102783-Prymnesium_polylepis.1